MDFSVWLLIAAIDEDKVLLSVKTRTHRLTDFRVVLPWRD
jgi:hypothetical protein